MTINKKITCGAGDGGLRGRGKGVWIRVFRLAPAGQGKDEGIRVAGLLVPWGEATKVVIPSELHSPQYRLSTQRSLGSNIL